MYCLALFFLVLASLCFKETSYVTSRFSFPKVQEKQAPRVLIHSVSLGESQVAVTFAKELKQRYPEIEIYISCITQTALNYLQKQEGIRSFFLPYDFPWIMKKMMAHYQFNGVIFVETDFWLNLMKQAKKQGAFVAVVNGKISEKSAKRFAAASFFSNKLFSLIDCFCVQNEDYLKLFQTFIKDVPLQVCGNLKLDAKVVVKQQIRQELGIKPQELVIVFGSTHDPEESLIIKKIKPLLSKYPIRVLIVPRHPERFEKVYALLKEHKLSVSKYSDPKDTQVFVIDQMGILNDCYEACDIAFVAGSFTPKVGGHNILEPARFGVPVLFGPHMESQKEFCDLAHQHAIGLQVSEELLASTLEQWINDPSLRTSYGLNGKKLMQQAQGAKDKTIGLFESCQLLGTLR